MQAVESATAFLIAETGRLHGRDKVDVLGIEKSDVGRALGTYLLTPDVANAVGEADTRKLGQMLMVFGLAPAFGLADEAQKQITEKKQETIHEGSANFLTGTAFGAILEGHPAVALSIGAVMTATFLQDQLFSPANKARNEEVLDLYSKTGNFSPEELINFCDKSKQLLGPEAYKASFDLATGGIGIPHGHVAARGIKTDGGNFDIGAMTKSAAERLKQLPHEAMRFINEIVGHEPAFQPADGPRLNRHIPIAPEKNENSLFMTGADNLEGKGAKKGKSHIEGELMEGVQYQIDKSTGRLQRTDLGKIRAPYHWKVMNEEFSPDVVRQKHELSCVSGCGEMITNGDVKEERLIKELLEYHHPENRREKMPACVDWLAEELCKQFKNALWKGGNMSKLKLDGLLKKGRFVAELKEPGDPLAHAVLIEGMNKKGNLEIVDPWEGTKYEMTQNEFFEFWTENACFKENK